MKTLIRISGLFAFLSFSSAYATSYYVDTADQFNAKVDKNGASFSTLGSGDRVYLKGGHWGGLVAMITGSMTDAEAQANPAKILACDASYNPTSGQVIVDGLTAINLKGTGVGLYGVTFSDSSGMKKAGNFNDYSGGNDKVVPKISESSAYMISLDGGSRYMTLSHLKFDHCGRDTVDYLNNDHYGAWIYMEGYRHTMQFCEMEGRDFDPNDINVSDPTLRKSIRQATVVIYKSDSIDLKDYGFHNIHHNYFGPRRVPKSSDPRLPIAADGTLASELSNGWECIRVGNSSYVEVDFNCTIEKNTFYQAIQSVDGGANDGTGDPEMISNKSRRNTYRYNTILNNYGELCLRQGDYCVVQGNYFLSGGAYHTNGSVVLTEAQNTQMGGVRAFGFGHVIANNYFYKINGSGIRSALILGSGETATGTLSRLTNGANGPSYETANYAQVIGNSFIDCKVLTLDNPITSTNTIYPVYGTQFFNNLVYYSTNITASGLIGNTNYGSLLLSYRGGRAAGNYVYSATTNQLGSATALFGNTWMSEAFAGYTNGQTLTNTLSPTLIASSGNPTYYTKITNDGGNVAQYLKSVTNNGSQVMFAFSPTNIMTARTNGYVSFRIKQNIDTNIPTDNALDVGIGNNVSATTTSSSTNRLIGISFKQSGTATSTLTVSSAGKTIVGNFNNTNSTSFSKAEIWFNDSDTNSLSYVNPSGVSMNLATNSFVVYINSNLVTTTNLGNAPLYSGTNSSGGIPAAGSLNIGKIGFSTVSTGTINFSFDDILAADSENTSLNVISSLPADNPLFLSGTYDVLTVPTGTSPLVGKAAALLAVNDTSESVSSTGTPFDLAGTVATNAALDMRGLTRPVTGRDIGNYEVEVTGLGNRPLRRTEVGVVAATYPNSIQVNSITQGVAFSQQLSASFGTGTLSWSAIGILPTGLSLTSGGLLSGTVSGGGTYPVTIRVTDASGSYAEISTSLAVVAPVVAPVISSSLTATGTVNSAFTYQITASNNPTSFGASNLPSGLGVNPTNGLISGTPLAAGTNNVTLQASNAGGTGTSSLTLTVNAAVATPVITSTNSASGTVGSAFSYQITATNNPTSFGASNLPAGLSNNPSTGLISGTPASAGTNNVTLSASNAGGTGTKNLTLTISPDYFALIRSRRSSSLIAEGLAASGVSSISSKAYGFWKSNSVPLNTSSNSNSTALWSDLPLKYPSTGLTADTASGNMVTTFSRIEKMAQAWATPGCSVSVVTVTGSTTSTNTVTLTGNVELATAVVNALDWMVANNYTSTATQYGNWFDWEVQGALNFVDTQILIYSQLSAAQIASYAAAVDNYGPNSANNRQQFSWGPLTGANTTSVALVATLRGALAKEASKIAEINGPSAVPEVFLPVTDGDGFYEDGSYVFHDNVAYNGHYGYVMLEEVTILSALLDGTPWTIVDSNYPYVYEWITKGFMPFYYRGSFMDCVRGRFVGTSGETGPDVGTEILGYIQTVANNSLTPTSLKTTFNNFVANPHPSTGQYDFYNMDRVVAHRDNYSFALSMSSTRVNNYEDNFGDANTKGYFQGDGMTYLYVGNTDTQFVNGYWPSVDIYHLTGTTTEQGTVSTPKATDQSFVGGADVKDSNGSPVYGVAAFSLHPYLEQKDTSVVPSVTRSNVSTLYGKKSYFMFKDEVVCLGAGITAGSTNEIHTTVENRAMGTASNTATLWVNGASTSRNLGSSGVLTNLTNCAIQGVGGYHFFDSPGNLQAAFQQSSGTWGAIHPGDSDTKTYTNNYLKLYYRHGVRPTNATYAYTLLPAMTPSEVKGYAYNPQTTILSNTATVQAVKNPALGVVAANFWDSTGGTADLLEVNKSCSVIVRETYDAISVGLSDPSQSLTGSGGEITVTLNRTGTLSSKDAEVRDVRTNPTIQFTANVSGAKGKTIHATFSLSTPAPQITSSPNLLAWTGSPVSYQISSDTSGATYAVTSLPPGLTLYESGLIYGTPTESGTFTTTISATSTTGRVGYANLTIQVSDNLSSLSTTHGTSGTWICPANVTAVQVEAWGGGGAGGSACQNGGSAAAGGGGAGGAYAKVVSYPVTPGNTYYINVGAGGTNSSTNNDTKVSGGDSWFNSSNSPSTTILAKGGGGGASAIGERVYGSGGLPTAGSLGDVIYAGGAGIAPPSGRFGGGGGGSAGTNSVGLAPASNTNGVGASAVMGGGNGGNANPTASSSSNGQSPTIPPGGGGGGARDGSYVLPQVRSGGAGAAGQVILTLRMKTNSTISILGGTFTYSGSPQGPGLESVTKTGSTNSNLTYRYEGVAPTLYSASSTRPTDAGTYTVTATVPEDTNSMAAVSTPALFTIVPATPPPPSASPITYGQTLASSVVSGTANVGGVWRWANEALIPPAGISFQTATFTPTDTKNYTTTTANVSVTVNQAIPIFSLPATGAITLTYGQALFNWSSWNSGSGGVLSWVDPNLTPGLGDSLQSVLFTPSDTVNYAAVNSSVTVRVNRADPVISQAPVATAIASGETLASSFLSGGVANIEGNFAWTSSGTMPGVTEDQSVTFTPRDSVNYNSVTNPVNVVVTTPFRQGSWVNLADDGRLLYKRDDLGNRIPDFTACGYKAGKEGIPYVPTRVVVKPGDGDDRARIQAGIDRVAAMTPDANGFRGAVLLTAGEYQVSGPLLISTSGVVLRGVGESETEGTRLKSTDRSGVYNSNQTILLQIQGSGSPSGTGTAQEITSPYVPAGSSSFEVASVSGFSVGSEVEVYRPCTTNWITAIGMDQLSPIEDRWKAGMRDLYWHRTIQRIEGNRIFLDAPITTAIDQTYGGGKVQKYTFAGRIEKCGVEDIRGLSSYDPEIKDSSGNYIDEAHAWTFIEIESAQNCWVRRVTSRYFAYSCVSLMQGAKWVSVLNCQSLDPVSVVDGGRRYAFNLDDCELCLVKDCTNDSDRHQFVTHSNTSGPNAFVNGTSTRAFSECGPHHEWANGILWDRITVSGSLATFAIRNRGNAGSGHGWAAANSLAWNCAAPEFDVENPPTARNWMVGCVGTIDTYNSAAVPANPDFGTYDSNGASVFPVSLLGRQRQDTLGTPGLQIREYVVGDFDDCSTVDSASVDSTWLSAIKTLSASQIGTMDDTLTGKWIPWTHNFTVDSGNTILSATLWVGLRSTGTGWTDDVIYLDNSTQSVSLSSLGASLSETSTSVVRVDLGPYLAALSDGKLNLALSGDTAVDWSMLELRVASSSASSGSLTTLTPEADSTVDATNPTGNFGTSGSLTTLADSKTSLADSKTSYLRWNLQGISGKITRARVRLVPTSAGATTIENYAAVAGNGWDENTIQYTNQPAANGPMFSWKVQKDQAVEFDVTREVQEALTTDGKLSLQIGSARSIGSSGTVTYASREGGQPQLILTTTTAVNTAPTIASSGDQFVALGAVVEPVVLGVADAEKAATALVVTASSSNSALVPNDSAHLTLGGGAGVRSLQVTPVPGVTGTATITVNVSDGALSSSTTFLVGVRNVPVLSWPSITSAPLMYGTPATTSNVLKATSSVAGSFVYSPAAGSILSPGTNQVVATFTPTDTSTYLSGGTITNIVSVMPAFFFTNGGTTNWICPSNVTSVQVECWGAGGAGGSAYKPGSGNALGGGGAGGSYAKKTNLTVVPGNIYTINVGAGGVSTITNGGTVPGGNSWFGSSSLTNCLAKGGAGGQSVVSSGSSTNGAGGTNSSGSSGDIVYQGGNGVVGQSSASAGGGGGSSAGTASAGTTATSYLGASAGTGGGAGGNGKDSSHGDGLSGASPGGGGGGARATTSATSGGGQTFGGTGGMGQVIVSVKTITANLTLGGLAQTYDGNPKSVTVTTDPANLNTVVTYNGSSNLPTAGGSYAVVATINENNYSGTNSGTLVIAKVSQTITFGLDPVTAKVGDAARLLIATSSSGLPVTFTSLNTNVATITGGNTLNFVGIGTTTITAKQAGNLNYDAAADVQVVLNVTASAGPTFTDMFGTNPTYVGTDGLAYLMKYALGGTNTNDKVSLPTISLNGSNVTLTAVVRTNDTNLTIIGQSTTNLAGTWTTISPNSNGVASIVSTNTNSVPLGCQRRDFSVPKDTNSRLFLRLKATQ